MREQRASEAKRETDALHIVEARAAELTGRIAGLAGEQDSAKRSMEDAKGAVEESKQLEAVARHLDAKRQYDGNELAIEKAKALREKVARLRDEAKALETRLATLMLPMKAQLQSLRTLGTQARPRGGRDCTRIVGPTRARARGIHQHGRRARD